jgi:murein DD-endopeptidase MepM/ murein hydrolase activator NlpD
MAAPVAAIAVRTIGLKRMLQIVAAIIVLALALLISAVALPVMAVTMLGNGVAVGAEPAPTPGAGGELVPSDQGWWRPTSGPITSWYGPRRIICGGTGCSTPFHQGIDFGTSCGTPVVSIYAGTVTFVGNAGGFGNRVIVDHGGGISSVYGHLAPGASVVTVGQQVEGGFQISQVGRTGVVSGCHLDLKITINGAHTDPAPFLRGKGITL